MISHHALSRVTPALLLFVALAAACGSDSSRSVETNDSVVTNDSMATNDSIPAEDSSTRPSLAGSWELTSITIDDAPVAIPSGAQVGLKIDQGQISGQGGCNSFSGQIEAQDGGEVLLSDLSWTEMGCGLLDFEMIYLPSLAGSNRWSVSPDGLTFTGPASELVYTAGPPVEHLPLAGTTWRFDTVFSGDGVERTASTPDMSRPPVDLRIVGPQATLSSPDCASVTLDLVVSGERDGPFAASSPDSAERPTCDDPSSNLLVAFDGLIASTGFMIHQQRLTLIGLPGETVGFTGDK